MVVAGANVIAVFGWNVGGWLNKTISVWKSPQLSLLVFLECWSITAMGTRRIMELERASLLLASRFGHQCQCLMVACNGKQQSTPRSQQQQQHEQGSNSIK